MPDGNVIRDLPRQSRAADVVTVNAEARTVELVWSTGARVRRFDWWTGKRYDEELSMEPAAVDLSRLNGGAPLLTDHRMYDAAAVIGVVERAWLDGGEGRAVVRFHDDEASELVFAKVRNKVLRNVSITYAVSRYEITEEEGKPPLYRAVDWQPMEISMVAVGADAGAGTRSAPSAPVTPCEFVNRAVAAPIQEKPMDPTEKAAKLAAEEAETKRAADAKKVADEAAEQARQAGIAAERKRATEIRARVKKVGLPDEVADDLVARGVALEHVGDQIVDKIAERGGQVAKPGDIRVGYDGSDPAVKREIMVEALLARATRNFPQAARVAITDRARDYGNHSFLQMCAEIARAHGEKVPQHLPPAALFDRLTGIRSLSTSDFPLLLADAGNKIMVKAYELAQPTYRLVFGRKTFRDFKAHKFLRGGDFPVPLEKGETGEFKFGSMSEAKQEITMVEYGRIVGISRRIIINDDMGAFADLPAKAGRRIADFENATAWAQKALNSGDGPTITETGRALFNTTDSTKAGSGAAISVTTVGAGRAAMMKQTSLDGLKMNVMPRYLVTSPDSFTVAEQFCSVNIVPAQDSNANPFKGRLTPVGDANLTGDDWMLFADPADIETLVYGYLEGAEGPQLATREGFTTSGMELKVNLDFVAGAIDFRGAYMNPGS